MFLPQSNAINNLVNFHTSNTEMVIKHWYDFLGEVNGSSKWGELILEDYVTGKHY